MPRKDNDIQVVDEDLLPDGESLDTSPEDDGFDIGALRVNFSDKEASSEARDFSPLPAGKYHVAITEVETKFCGPESKNPGKPYYSMQLTVQSGPFENRKVFTNVMLFDGALYSLVQILKAQGWPLNGSVPTPDKLLGTVYLCQVSKAVDLYKINKSKEDGSFDASEPKPFKNEIKNFGRYDGSVSVSSPAAGGAGDSLMP